ncbi:class I tRNA ligase family protein [Streptomyces sporangiiformans]|uniref:Methionyl-tRNA synthetase n=1 Tax=Streptomyces sporangiiformans TaxID=2315329 RepID=A0A505D8D7_9ACTN|nr:class I tRNA ligase family protein [Streptomyces sporangiiformans]TPQ18612.1 class I tRNA ligase family protein [Streptomyces sporangiiformans]
MTADGRLTVLTTPPPTPNGPLHVGHLSGPYIAADVAARAARHRGERVLTMTGLDSHQNYVAAKAAAEGRPVPDVVHTYGTEIRAAFRQARIDYDVLADPTEDADYRKAVDRLMAELVGTGAFVMEETVYQACAECGRTLHHAYVSGTCPRCGEGMGGGACEGCAGFATAGTMVEARSTCCGAPAVERRAELPVLHMESYRTQLLETWARAHVPASAMMLIHHYLDAGLPDVLAAYPTDWGIELGALPGLRADVWIEMAVGYLYAIARAVDPAVFSLAECVNAWQQVGELWHFLGIDNAFYYTIAIPAVFAAAGVPAGTLGGLVVNEFYRLEGLKFSTSRNHAIWANELLAAEDPGLVRLFLCYDRPDRYGSDFTLDAFRAFQKAPPRGDGDLARAQAALRLPGFDPALAVRCLGAAPNPLRPLLTGES